MATQDSTRARTDGIETKTRQLRALLLALSTPTDDPLAPNIMDDALWLAIDLSDEILKGTARIHSPT